MDRRTREAAPRGKTGKNPWGRAILEGRKWTSIDDRRHRILDALFKTAETCGLKVKDSDHGTYFEVEGERIDFRLREKQRQVRRPKTPEERRWSGPEGRDWAQELQPSGILSFTIETYIPGLPQRAWTETQVSPLEGRVGEILAALIAAGPLLVQLRGQREEEDRRRREEEQRRYQEAERKRLDDNRWRRFLDFSTSWRQAEAAQHFIAALEAQQPNLDAVVGGKSVADWFEWARERLGELDPLTDGAPGVFEGVARVTAWTYRP